MIFDKKSKNKVKALFILPPFSDFYISRDRLYPNNAILISKILENLNITTIIADFRFGIIKKIKIPINLSYLEKFYKKDYTAFSLFNDYNYYGLSSKKDQLEFFKNFLKKYSKPDIILISANFTAYRSHVINLIETIVEFFTEDIFLIVGGNDVIINKNYYEKKIQQLLVEKNTGQEKITIYDRDELKSFKRIIKGIYKKLSKNNFEKNNYYQSSFSKKMVIFGRKIIKFYYLDKILYYNPAKKQILIVKPLKLYVKGSLLLSYGCPNKCSYCFYSAAKFEKFHYKNKRDILKDLFALKEEGFDYIHLEDDSFTSNKKKAIEILNLIILFNKKIKKFYFDFPNGLNYHKIDDKILNLFQKANIKKISFSLGTINHKILEMTNRPAYLNKFNEIIDKVKKYDIETTAYIIAGIIGQDFYEIIDSFFFLFDMDIKIGFSPYYPVINSIDYIKHNYENQIMRKNFDEKYFASSSLFHFENSLTTSEKASLFKAYRIFSYLHNIKLKFKDWQKEIIRQYNEFIFRNNINITKIIFNNNLSDLYEKNIKIIIEKNYIKYIESFLLFIYFKTENLFIISDKKSGGNILILVMEKFPLDEKAKYFHKKIIRYFNNIDNNCF